MALGKRRAKQSTMWVASTILPKSPGHRFYEKLNELLLEASFDQRVEDACAPFYEDAGTAGRPSIEPGVYFRMLLVGYFEGIESERGIAWRCSDSLSLRAFLGLSAEATVPDHSTLSKTRKRLGGEVFEGVFKLVLEIVARSGLLSGRVVGIDSTYLRADASMKSIVRKDTNEVYLEYIKRLAQEDGIKEPTVEDARREDRKRKGKRTSNQDWKSPTDEDARIARLKDGRTRLAYKAEHVVDMESGVVVQADLHAADESDTATMHENLEIARENIEAAQENARKSDDDDLGGGASSCANTTDIIEVVADKGYHKVELLEQLKVSDFRTYIPERKQATRRWTDKSPEQKRAFFENRARTKRTKGKAHQRARGEKLERTFAHALESGAMRRLRLRGRENARKRYLIHVAAMNLAAIMRVRIGRGTPRGAADAVGALLFVLLVAWQPMMILAALLRRVVTKMAWNSERSSQLFVEGVDPRLEAA